MIAMNFVTPVRSVNLRYFSILSRISGPFTPQYIGSLEAIAWNQENLAGSPLHLLAVLLSTLFCWLLGRKKENRLLAGYGASALVGFSLLAFIGHVTVVYSIRYQLAYLVMGAPLVGIMVGRIRKGGIRNLTMLGLLIYALPYLLISNMRPLIGMPPWPTRVGSIFTTEPAEILFALNSGNLDEYQRVTGSIEEKSCMKVGLWLYHEDLEYTFWWLLNAPQSGVELRFIRTEPALERYLEPDYSPCAIICTQCQGLAKVDGLPLNADFGQIQLYLGE